MPCSIACCITAKCLSAPHSAGALKRCRPRALRIERFAANSQRGAETAAPLVGVSRAALVASLRSYTLSPSALRIWVPGFHCKKDSASKRIFNLCSLPHFADGIQTLQCSGEKCTSEDVAFHRRNCSSGKAGENTPAFGGVTRRRRQFRRPHIVLKRAARSQLLSPELSSSSSSEPRGELNVRSAAFVAITWEIRVKRPLPLTL